ncbi:MAG: dethiobiotin synthase [Flavobacteriaceae bacterium]|nr:dethiobiotin synthase [Flavobacteriaceae bacterium]
MRRIFVVGISNAVGKTIACAIITEALEADYFKPIQTGVLYDSDVDAIDELLSNKKTTIFEGIALKEPYDPHFAAELEQRNISTEDIKFPETESPLVIEFAGGVLVPINDTEILLDVVNPEDQIVLVSRNYLGSVNHTLLSIEALKSRGLNNINVLFSGKENTSNQQLIEKISHCNILGRIEQEIYGFDKKTIKKYANRFKLALEKLV